MTDQTTTAQDAAALRARIAELESILVELWERVDDAGSLIATSYVEEALGPRPANCRETRNYQPSRKSAPEPVRAYGPGDQTEISTCGWTA
jgi:hypothetical protein